MKERPPFYFEFVVNFIISSSGLSELRVFGKTRYVRYRESNDESERRVWKKVQAGFEEDRIEIVAKLLQKRGPN